MINPRDT